MRHIAVISVHGSPLASLGGKETGGMNVYVRELSVELGRKGFAVDIFTRRKDNSIPEIIDVAENVRLITLKAGEAAEIDKNQVYYALPEFTVNLLRFCQESGLVYDILHSHYWLSGWVGHLLSQRWHVPHVVMFHTLGEGKNRARIGESESRLRIDTEKKIVASADCLIAASPNEKNQMVRLYNASPHNIEVVPCGVNLELFKPMDKKLARKELGLNERGRIVLFVGRIDPVKGLDILLNSLAMLEDLSEVQLLVVGGNLETDPELMKLQRMCVELGIADNVKFHGAVSQESLPLFYNAADLSVVPSYYESFGLVAVESLACGTPVIASRVGGLSTTVRDGETGYLIPWRCPDPFAERLELLLGNESLRSQMGRAARKSVEKLSWGSVADKIGEVYCHLWEKNTLHAANSRA